MNNPKRASRSSLGLAILVTLGSVGWQIAKHSDALLGTPAMLALVAAGTGTFAVLAGMALFHIERQITSPMMTDRDGNRQNGSPLTLAVGLGTLIIHVMATYRVSAWLAQGGAASLLAT
ncbi:hypothetical protein [Maricaulis sp.]|uniref:hypothetical protein n=1 Tax=Maricaulis sp. TaxID=1486257 RepID=UPI002B272C46|nr:hypothetical protein [Maricaulis sp.]